MNATAEPPPVRLLDRLRAELRARHYSIRTERAYLAWARRYIVFHGRRHPRDLNASDLRTFLQSLVETNASASTHHQALSAIAFLYKHALGIPVPWIDDLVRPARPVRLPIVLTRQEVRAILAQMNGTPKLMAAVLYGAGLRLLECARLRVKDIDFAAGHIVVRDGKGRKDRITLLPDRLRPPLRDHLQRVRELHAADLEAQSGTVWLPDALTRKYPGASRSWHWQWAFPATRQYRDRQTGELRRHHLHETVL
jgi:integron integrase